MSKTITNDEVKQQRRLALIEGLRALATFLETHPGAPATSSTTVLACLNTADDLKAAARAIGTAAKQFEGQWVSLIKDFGPVRYEVFIPREQVCEKTVVGTRTVPEHTEEIVEWSCNESILGL